MINKLNSKIVYKNKWISVTEDEVEFANGHRGIYSVVHKPACGLAIPYQNGKFTLVRLYRYPTQRFGWEFPMGAHEEDPQMEPEVIVKAELKEETGLVAGKCEFLGKLYFANGFATQPFYSYLMTHLTQQSNELEITEELEVKEFSFKEIEGLIDSGEIVDGPTVSALYLLKMKKPDLFR